VVDGAAADERLASLASTPTSALLEKEIPQHQEQLLQSTSTYTLRKTLIGIAKGFLERYHDSNKAKLVATVDAEKWTQCEVSAHRQACIDLLTSGKIVLFSSAPLKGGGHLDVDEARYAGMPSSAFVTIDSQTFKVAWSSLQLVEMLLSYLGLAAVFRGKIVEDSIIPKLSELLQLFDKHSKRLVLGAQAMKSAAQLKSISARHLAVTMQSVSLLSSLLPHIRAALLGYLTSSSFSSGAGSGGGATVANSASSMLVELDRISNEYMEHTSALLSKFVHIVGDAVDASQPKLSKTDWDRFHGQCEYFDDLIKNITALHRVLVSILPPEVVQSVFSRIFVFLNRKINSHFEDVMPSTQTGRQRVVDEVSHLVVSFQQLSCVNAAAAIPIEEAFRKKYEAAAKM
jgi:vacuolar protein sorting-associated protein 54